VGAPETLTFLGFKLDDGAALAILGPETLVRDVTGCCSGQFGHAFNQGNILVLEAGHQPRAENGDDHDGLLLALFWRGPGFDPMHVFDGGDPQARSTIAASS